MSENLLISEPPSNRYPVQTYVMEYDFDAVFRDWMIAAEETPALCNVSLIQLGSRRNDSRRIELQFHSKSSGIHLPDLDILQGPEVITRKRPA